MMVQVELNEKIYKSVNTTLNMACVEVVTAFTHALELLQGPVLPQTPCLAPMDILFSGLNANMLGCHLSRKNHFHLSSEEIACKFEAWNSVGTTTAGPKLYEANIIWTKLSHRRLFSHFPLQNKTHSCKNSSVVAMQMTCKHLQLSCYQAWIFNKTQ